MPSLISDPAGRATHSVFDANESRDIVDALTFVRSWVREQKRNPNVMLPDRLEVLAKCSQQVVTGQKVADGLHPSPETYERDEMLGVRQIVDEFGIPERTARRLCETYGRKVSGRWIVNRTAIELVR